MRKMSVFDKPHLLAIDFQPIATAYRLAVIGFFRELAAKIFEIHFAHGQADLIPNSCRNNSV